MKASFAYEQKTSKIFKRVRRPIARASFWSKYFNQWLDYTMIVDTGADYTLSLCPSLTIWASIWNKIAINTKPGALAAVKQCILSAKKC